MPDPLGEMDSSLSVKLLVSKCISSQQTFVSLFIHLYLFYYVDKKQECCYESWFVFMYWQPSITWSKILNVMSFFKSLYSLKYKCQGEEVLVLMNMTLVSPFASKNKNKICYCILLQDLLTKNLLIHSCLQWLALYVI